MANGGDYLQNAVVQTDIVALSQPTGSAANYLGNGFKVMKLTLYILILSFGKRF
jgi:hypothetical protein